MSKATIEEHKKSRKGKPESRKGKPESKVQHNIKFIDLPHRDKYLNKLYPEDRRRSKPIRELRKFIKEQRGRSAASSAEKPDSNKRSKGKKGWSKGERCRMYSDTKCV